MFDIVSEVMPQLGYRILRGELVRGYSQKSGSAVWRLDRPCRHLIRKHGVQARQYWLTVSDAGPFSSKPHRQLMTLPKKARTFRGTPAKSASVPLDADGGD